MVPKTRSDYMLISVALEFVLLILFQKLKRGPFTVLLESGVVANPGEKELKGGSGGILKIWPPTSATGPDFLLTSST